METAGGTTHTPNAPGRGWGGGRPWAKAPKEPTTAAQWETRLKEAKLWRARRGHHTSSEPRGAGRGALGGSGVLCGARATGMGVGRGRSLQGASAGLRGRQHGGRAAISRVCVEVQPPVRFAQRPAASFARTRAFPPPETQGETAAGRDGRKPGRGAGAGKQDRSKVKKTQTTPQTCLSLLFSVLALSRHAWLPGARGAAPASGSSTASYRARGSRTSLQKAVWPSR